MNSSSSIFSFKKSIFNQYKDKMNICSSPKSCKTSSKSNQNIVLNKKSEEKNKIIYSNKLESNINDYNNKNQFCLVNQVINTNLNIPSDMNKNNFSIENPINFSLKQINNELQRQQFLNSSFNFNSVKLKKCSKVRYKLLIKKISSGLKKRVNTPTKGYFYFAFQKGDFPLLIIKKIKSQIIAHTIELSSHIFSNYVEKYNKYIELVKRIAFLLKKGTNSSKYAKNNSPFKINLKNNKNMCVEVKIAKITKSNNINNDKINDKIIINETKEKNLFSKINNRNLKKIKDITNFQNNKLEKYISNPFINKNLITSQNNNDTHLFASDCPTKILVKENNEINNQISHIELNLSNQINKNPFLPDINKGNINNELKNKASNNGTNSSFKGLSSKYLTSDVKGKCENNINSESKKSNYSKNIFNDYSKNNNMTKENLNSNKIKEKNTNKKDNVNLNNISNNISNAHINEKGIINFDFDNKNKSLLSFNSEKNPSKKIEIKILPLKKENENQAFPKNDYQENNDLFIRNNQNGVKDQNYINLNKLNEQNLFVKGYENFLKNNNIIIHFDLPISKDQKNIDILKQSIFWETYIYYLYNKYLINKTNKISIFILIQLIEQYFIWCENINSENINNFKKMIIETINNIFNEKEKSLFLSMNKITKFEELFDKYDKVKNNNYIPSKEIEIKFDYCNICNCEICKNDKACIQKVAAINEKKITNENINNLFFPAENINEKHNNKNNNLVFCKSKTLHSFENVLQYIPSKKKEIKFSQRKTKIKKENLSEIRSSSNEKQNPIKSDEKNKKKKIENSNKKENNSEKIIENEKFIDIEETREINKNQHNENLKDKFIYPKKKKKNINDEREKSIHNEKKKNKIITINNIVDKNNIKIKNVLILRKKGE